ncbi:MAG TPA: M23 family metallopeptidase [Thermoanaerobaculia bacterium]|nr:M23 family metallopeptidase [Thermoanaerobaculia bacterium]
MKSTDLYVGETRKRSAGPLRLVLLLVLLVALAWVAVATLRVGPAPEIAVEPALPGIGPATPVAVTLEAGGRGLGPWRVELVQGDAVTPVAQNEVEPPSAWKPWASGSHRAETEIEVGHASIRGLRQGEATLRVVAERASTWLRHPDPAVAEVTLPVRVTPPSIELLSSQHYAVQGGAEAVVYRVGAAAAESGVRSGEAFFPGVQVDGVVDGDGERVALFAVPYDLGSADEIRLVVADDVGNRAELPFLDGFTPRPYAEGTIGLDDAFMARVVPAIADRTPGFQTRGSVLEDYLWINRELREQNRAQVAELCAASPPEIPWNRPFVAMPNAAVMSSFATRRTYTHGGEPVDEQFHLGYDLASVKQAEVPAANAGRVVYADYLGIYGNVVMVDHGLGLVSLYGHLSSMAVAVGDGVERGQTVGRTGVTGLSGGDHLHFGLFLRGHAVDPRQWWDGSWIENRVAAKLGDGWAYEQ